MIGAMPRRPTHPTPIAQTIANRELPPYLDLDAFAALTGYTPTTMRGYRTRGQLPDPDTYLGKTPGWRPATCIQWAATKELTTPAPVYLDDVAASAHLGINPGTWRAYKSENRTPAPDLTLGQSAGWLAETLDTWNAARPGPGARTDRKAKP